MRLACDERVCVVKGERKKKEDTLSVNKREREKWLMSILVVVVERVTNRRVQNNTKNLGYSVL